MRDPRILAVFTIWSTYNQNIAIPREITFPPAVPVSF